MAAVTLLSACIPLFPHTKFEPPDAHFPGIKEAMKEDSLVWLLVVHGMGSKQPGDSQDFSDLLAGELNRELKLSLVRDCDKQIPEPHRDPGAILLPCKYARPGSSARLRVYELTWSPLTQPFKDTFLAQDSDGLPAKDRVWLDRKLKKDLVNSSLSDAVLYLGEMRQEILKSARWAIQYIVRQRDALKKDARSHPLFLIGHSLGTQIVFEVIQEMKSSKSAELETSAEDFTKDLQAVYMLANPLPLLCLHDLKKDQLKEKPDLPAACRWLDKSGQKLVATGRNLPVVTFSDPNDLLSYPTAGAVTGDGRFRFVTVQLRIANWAYLGVAVNPWEAHTGYWKNPEVIRLIACGHGSESRCQQQQ